MSNTTALSEKKNTTILFVDDEPLSLKYFKASIGKYANVRTANSPEAALEILETEGDEISVVVSDERMPRDSGVSFLSDVRKSWPSAVRVLTSAYADIENLQHAINDAAIFRFVPKPWNLDELCTAMQEALQVEQDAAAVSEPILGHAPDGDAKDANLALLSVLANGLERPLKSLDAESAHLNQLMNQGSLEAPASATSYMETWSSRLRQSKITASTAQIQKDIEHCRALANSIGKLARGLLSPAATPASSMADTVLEVIEQGTNGTTGELTLDTSNDFSYGMPREIMKFVLSSLLRGGATARRSQPPPPARITLTNGTSHNELRLDLELGQSSMSLDENQAWRTIRSALWAFGGELLVSPANVSGRTSFIVCLPKPL
ncbi:MAG: response regulator [Hyphomicrobium sp.]|uniref:response regulator n=1 Tax=Hyphomicrobium sp. TaxID=82 RepID=UPI0039E51615